MLFCWSILKKILVNNIKKSFRSSKVYFWLIPVYFLLADSEHLRFMDCAAFVSLVLMIFALILYLLIRN